MTCRAIRLWTFNGIVAAFLDLGIAYLLLCASTLVYFTSKFLGLFGLCLPCPCDGLFANLGSEHCFQTLLVDRSSKKISSVLNSVEEKFPFDSMRDKDPKCCFKSMLVRNVEDRNVELEGEALHSSFSETRPQGVVSRDFPGEKELDAVAGLTSSKVEGKFYIMGKGVASQRSGNNLHHRHKGVMGHTSLSSNDSLQLDMEDVFQSPLSLGRFEDNDPDDSFFSVDSGDQREEASADNSDQDKMSPDLELDDSHEEKRFPEMDKSSAEEAENICRGKLGLDDNESETITLLEQALEEEHAARATLYLELEKERSAAATAADEAMAMILRLQEEKALIEMDARQYQRIIEEKTAYDAEEMNILKEILLRREREMYFLEKEVEAYRKNFFGDDEVDADMLDLAATPQRTSSFPYATDDQSLMHQRINRPISGEQDANYTKISSKHAIPSIESRNLAFEFGEESPMIQVDELADTVKAGGICLHESAKKRPHKSNDGNEINNDLQEKGMISDDENSYIQQEVVNDLGANLQINESNGLGMGEKSIISVGDEHDKVNNACEGLASSKIILPLVEHNGETHDDNQNQWTRELNSVTGTEPHLHDIIGIDDEASTHSEVNVNASEELVVNGTSSIQGKCDSPFISLFEHEPDITRSSSDATGRFPLIARSRGNHLCSELRRNSMSAVDYERSKIGNEVEWLRERLKVVQEGREKLKFNMEYKEKENNQLQLLENITNHLQEIQQLTETGKAIRLPPSSKDMSKKRCWRSSSLSIHRSN